MKSLLQITEIKAALSTLQICYRQSCKDSWKIYNAVTSDRAIAYYRFALRLAIVACGLVYLAGRTCGVLWYQWIEPRIDAHIEKCQAPVETPSKPVSSLTGHYTPQYWRELLAANDHTVSGTVDATNDNDVFAIDRSTASNLNSTHQANSGSSRDCDRRTRYRNAAIYVYGQVAVYGQRVILAYLSCTILLYRQLLILPYRRLAV